MPEAYTVLLFVTLFMSLYVSIFFMLTFFQNIKKIGNPRLTKKSKVTIIIPAYNEAKTIVKTIKSALAIDWPKRLLEIIVIENGGSTDGTLAIAKKYQKFGVKVLSRKPGGKGAAMNYVIKNYATGEFIISMDCDTTMRPDILTKLMGYFYDPQVMAVSSAIKIRKAKTILQRIQTIEYLFGVFMRKVFSFLDAIYVTPGAFTVYRASFFKKHGGYDETNITEDMEIILRIQSLGYKVKNSINGCVYTGGHTKLKDLHDQRIRWFVGYIDTISQYRQLFNPKNGYLGTIILPTAILSIIFTITLFFNIAYTFLKNGYRFISNYYALFLADSDWSPLIYYLKFDWFYYTMDMLLFLIIILLSLSLLMFFLARTYSDDKDAFVLGYLGYFAIYIFLFASWWISAAYVKLFGGNLRFGGVKWNNSIAGQLKQKLANRQ